jgi:hypothetical protein
MNRFLGWNLRTRAQRGKGGENEVEKPQLQNKGVRTCYEICKGKDFGMREGAIKKHFKLFKLLHFVKKGDTENVR